MLLSSVASPAQKNRVDENGVDVFLVMPFRLLEILFSVFLCPFQNLLASNFLKNFFLNGGFLQVRKSKSI